MGHEDKKSYYFYEGSFILHKTSIYNFYLNEKMTKVFYVPGVLQNSALRV
jgi:hypothetical protein